MRLPLLAHLGDQHDAESQLGFDEPPGRMRPAVERTAPVAILLHALVVLWFGREGHRRCAAAAPLAARGFRHVSTGIH
jgi:hypothetical protein